MDWGEVGEWLKKNAGKGVALIGSLVTGNVPGAIALGTSLIASATGTDDPAEALAELQKNPEAMLKLKELTQANDADIRRHLEVMHRDDLQDKQAAHHEQQETIRQGDQANDEYVRRTRPQMARQSWYATIFYVIGFEFLKAIDVFKTGASMELAMILIGPAAAYIGFRTWDKHNVAKFEALAK